MAVVSLAICSLSFLTVVSARFIKESNSPMCPCNRAVTAQFEDTLLCRRTISPTIATKAQSSGHASLRNSSTSIVIYSLYLGQLLSVPSFINASIAEISAALSIAVSIEVADVLTASLYFCIAEGTAVPLSIFRT